MIDSQAKLCFKVSYAASEGGATYIAPSDCRGPLPPDFPTKAVLPKYTQKSLIALTFLSYLLKLIVTFQITFLGYIFKLHY